MFNKVILNDAKKVLWESSILLWLLLKKCSYRYLAVCLVCLVVLTVYPVCQNTRQRLKEAKNQQVALNATGA